MSGHGRGCAQTGQRAAAGERGGTTAHRLLRLPCWQWGEGIGSKGLRRARTGILFCFLNNKNKGSQQVDSCGDDALCRSHSTAGGARVGDGKMEEDGPQYISEEGWRGTASVGTATRVRVWQVR